METGPVKLTNKVLTEIKIPTEMKDNKEKKQLNTIIENEEGETCTEEKNCKKKYICSIKNKIVKKKNNYCRNSVCTNINYGTKFAGKFKAKKKMVDKMKSLQQYFSEKNFYTKNENIQMGDKINENMYQTIKEIPFVSTIKPAENQKEIKINNYLAETKKIQEIINGAEKKIILPIIVIEDEYYDKILNFININGNERIKDEIKNEDDSSINEKTFDQNARKMKRNLNLIDNFNLKYKPIENTLKKLIKMRSKLPNFSPLNRKEFNKVFLAGIITNSNAYNIKEIKEIYEELQKNENFRQNYEQKIMLWANNYLSNIQIYCENVLNQIPSKVNNFLFITKISNEEVYEKNNEELSHVSKNINWNIIYHTNSIKDFKQIYEEVDYIEEEINCNFLITKNLKYLSKLVELIKLQNNKKNPIKIFISYILLINGKAAKNTLQFINRKQYNKYFNSIIIICDTNIEKIEKKIGEYKSMIKGIFNDKNEIILALKKNKSESLPMDVQPVISLSKYNNKYVFLHENIAKFYQNKFKEELEIKEDFELYLSQTFENESKGNFEKCLEELINSSLTEDTKKNIELLYEKNENEDEDSKREFEKFMKEFYTQNFKKILPQFREFVLKEEYESSIKKFADFVNSTQLDLKFKLSNLNLKYLECQLINETEENKIKKIKEAKSKSLINSVMFTFSEFDEKEKYKKIIDKYISEEESFFEDFNYWLRELDQNFYDKISYFISEIIRILNEYGKGLEEKDIILYKNLKMNFADLLEYKKYEGSAVFIPLFIAASSNKEKCEKIFSEVSKEEIEERKKKEEFNVLVNIEYNFDSKNKVFSCFDMSEFEKDNYLFLPFSSFKIKNVEISETKNTAIIKLIAINKKEILEKFINKNRKVYYDDINETIEIKKVKNILIHCTDTRELSDLKNRCKFMEELADGNFLITNTNEHFYKILSEIKKENSDMSKTEILIRFDLILFEATAKDTLSYIKENSYLGYFDNIIIMSGNEEKYKQELNENVVQNVFTNKSQVFNFIHQKAQGSLLPLQMFVLVTMSKYYSKYHIYHEIISKFYQKISENYFAVANEIIKDFISQNPNLINNDLIKCLRAFQDENVSPKARNRKIIRKYTSETGSFYQDFNNWLRSPDKTTIQKIGYFISNFMYSLNEYGREENKYVKGETELYRGLRLSFYDLLLYKMNINNDIIFLPPTSTSINRKTAEFFSCDGIKENQYAVMMIIRYNCKENEIPTAVDVTDLSEFGEDERLFLPFSFFKIKNVIINEKNRKAVIEMDALNREKINENEITHETIIKYDKEKKIMECTKNKVVVYNVENNKIKTNIFGSLFVKNNKNIVKLKIEEKIISLCENYSFKNQGDNLVEIIEKKPIKNASNMFFDCNSIISLDSMKNWNMFKVKNISKMFSGCSSIISVSPLKNWNVNNVEIATDLFSECISLTSIDALKFWNFNKILDTNCMFYNCSSIESILALKNWNMSHVLDVAAMFKNCSSIKSIDCLKDWNLDNVKNTNNMFCNCSSIISIDSLKNWNMDNVKNINSMFENCTSITSIDALKNWNVHNVNDMSNMFKNCKKIFDLSPLNNWNVEAVKNMTGMFEGCKGISSIEPLKNWKTKNLKIAMRIFKNCGGIDSISALSNWENNNVCNTSYMFCNCRKLKSINDMKNWNLKKVNEYDGMFENCLSVKSIEEIKDCNKKLYKIFNSTKDNRGSHFLSTIDNAIKEIANYDNIKYDKDSVKKISYYTENLNWEWEITIFGEEFVSKNKDKIVLNIYDKKIPLCSKYKMQNYGKNTIEIIEREPLTDLSYMFKNCKTLAVIDDLENWKLENITNTSNIFSGCPYVISSNELQNLDKNLTDWNKSSVTKTISKLKNNMSLNSVEDMLKRKMTNVQNNTSMCNNIKPVDELQNFGINKVIIMNAIFSNYNPISPIKKIKVSKVNENDRERTIKNCDAIIEEDEDDYKTVFLLSNAQN